MRKLKDIMTPHVDVISPDATAEDASAKMEDLDVGAIPVCEGKSLMGMITDRDLVIRVMAAGRSPKEVRVRQAMTPEVLFCYEDEEADKAAQIMAQKQIRRLPILSGNKELVGIVSLGDLAVYGMDARTSGDVLEQVSHPAQPRR